MTTFYRRAEAQRKSEKEAMPPKRKSEAQTIEIRRSPRKHATDKGKGEAPHVKKARVEKAGAGTSLTKRTVSETKEKEAETGSLTRKRTASKTAVEVAPLAGSSKKNKKEKAAAGEVKANVGKKEEVQSANILSRKIIVEACNQCKSFSERALKIKKELEAAVPDISVEINPQKPRLGYFEIREERTEVIISLPSMKRPFTTMKQLNMEELINNLVKRCI